MRAVVAVVAALVAAAVVWMLTSGGDEGDGGKDAGSLAVVRVVRDVTRGTPADTAIAEGALVVVEVAASEPGATTAVAPESLAGTIATAFVPAGGFVAPGQFAAPDGPGGAMLGRLPSAGHTALAVTVDATRAAGGWLQPGDRVNLLVPGVCADEAAAQTDAASSGGEVRCRRARYLYQAVDVLAVGAAVDRTGDLGNSGPVTGPLTVVLALPPRAAQWVATWENELTLALVSSDYVPRVVDPLPTVVDRLPGERAATLQPGCVDPEAPSPAGELQPCPEAAAP